MQIKNSFDAKTIEKILKGLGYSMIGAAAIAGLNYISGVDFGSALVNSLVGALVPTLINAVNQYTKGE